jgi:hypothetical protein
MHYGGRVREDTAVFDVKHFGRRQSPRRRSWAFLPRSLIYMHILNCNGQGLRSPADDPVFSNRYGLVKSPDGVLR